MTKCCLAVAILLGGGAQVAVAFSAESTTPSASASTVCAPSYPPSRPDATDFRSLLLGDAPLMDVRSPIEFGQGAFPSAISRPLMTNDERHQVGIRYKEDGQDAAIALGHALVHGESKSDRLRGWTEFCTSHPQVGYLYCFRGGLRSSTVQEWIYEETGVRYPLVEGGYKAMRRFLLDELDRSLEAPTTDMVLISGKTGVGKTRAIERLGHYSVDLEGLAHHRGSTFGRIPEDPTQPSQIDFENGVSIDFMKVLDKVQQRQRVFVEDEGNRIGNLVLPHVLRNRMKANDGILIIEESMEERLDVLVEDYIVDLRKRFVNIHGEDRGRDAHSRYLLGGLDRIKKKIGGDKHADISRTMTAALAEHDKRDDLTLHRAWVAALLDQYYDPMYDYALLQRDDRVLFRGERDAVVQWAMAAASNEMI